MADEPANPADAPWRAYLAVEAQRDRLAAQLAAVRELADDLAVEVDWYYGSNDAYADAARRIRAILAASPSTPEEGR